MALSVDSVGHPQSRAAIKSTQRHVFGGSISPNESEILLFAGNAVKGDSEEGTLELVNSAGRAKAFGEAGALPDNGVIAWVSDTVAYVSAAEAIFRVDSQREKIKIIVQGSVAGLAVSPKASRLAFWEVDDQDYKLTVYDLHSKRALRQWSLPATYSGHLSGFELAFVTEDRVVARTFDAEFKTPLKVFDIRRNLVTEITPNTYSLAPVPGGVAVILVRDGSRTLAKLTEKSGLAAVKREFEFDALESTGNPRWLVARTSARNVALIDTDNWSTHWLKPGCYPISIGRSGTAFAFRNGRVNRAPAQCVPGLPGAE